MKPLAAIVAASLLAGCLGEVTGGGDEEPPPPEPELCDPTAPLTAGPTPLRRLTREQLEHTLRDLLGVEGNYLEGVTPDERVGPFASNAVAPVSRTVVEQLQEVAEAAAGDADLAGLDGCNRLARSPAECATEFIERFGRRAYRRPLTADEVARHEAIYAEHSTTSHDQGLRVVVQGMLQSPNFLYHRVDVDSEAAPIDALVPLDGWAMASRLSYFLWSTMPDEALLAAAEAGELSTREGVAAQAERMLADPRAADAIGSFHVAWLGLSDLGVADKDPALYPEFDPDLADAMIRETRAFADHVIRNDDGSIRTLLTADWSIVPAELLPVYDVTPPSGHREGDPVLLDPARRAGILTHPSVLTAHSHYRLSSLTLRGKVVRENLFCQDLPDPPDGVDTTLPAEREGATTRERFQAHMDAGEACAGCHRATDPIGFGFESFDAIGRYRATDSGATVDVTGEIIGTDVDGEFDGATELAERLADSAQVEQCIARQWFRYAVGRLETRSDACSLSLVFDALEEPDDLRSTILAIVRSDAFRYRRQEP